MEIFAETQRPFQVQLSDSLGADHETGYETDSTYKKYLNGGIIHKVNFQKYLSDKDSECKDIDSDYTIAIISLLYFDLNKDGKDEAIITAQTCMMGNGGPDIHSVFYIDSLNKIQEYKIDFKPQKNTKIIGIPMHLIGNRNCILSIQDSMLYADYWDGSGRRHPLRQYFKFENGKFIVKKEVYGKTFHTSFDCNKARSDREIVACSCDSIAKMDTELSNLYNRLLSKLDPDQKSKMKKEQQQWLRDFDKVTAYRWLDEFSDRYRTRIEELKNSLTKVK